MATHIVTESGPLLAYLFKAFPKEGKIHLKQKLKFRSVQVNGRVVTAHDKHLKVGDKIEFLTKAKAAQEKLKASLSFPIVYEDNDMIVINKPSGLLTMGTDKEKIHTAYFELTDYVRSKDRRGRGRIFIVHRLDREASGLVVFAKNEKAKVTFQANWKDAVKKYYAVVEGAPVKSDDRIENYLAEDEFRRVYITGEKSRNAMHAVTLYRVLQRKQGFSLLEVTLVTGRKNQVRVHLSGMGHPIVGDKKYGSTTDPLGRLGLHAFYLSFKHPETGETKIFKTDLPGNF